MEEKNQMEYKKDLAQLVVDAARELQTEVDSGEVVLEHPADRSHGDFATPIALSLFSRMKSQPANFESQSEFNSPRQLAEKLAEIISQKAKTNFAATAAATAPPNLQNLKVTVAGPGFINFTFSEAFLVAKMTEIIQSRATYPLRQNNAQKRLLEHTSPNPNKAMHLGHLRNNVVGMAIGRIWQKVGYEVIYDAVDNNRGIAIAKLMWGFLKFARRDGQINTDIEYWLTHQEEWHTPESFGLRPDRFMDQLYVRAAEDFENPDSGEEADPERADSKEADSQEAQQNQNAKTRIKQMVIDWEAGDNANRQLWAKVLDYVYRGQLMTLERLGNHWDIVWHEHDHYQRGKDFVEQGLQMGIFRKLDDGAVVTDLEKDYGLTDTVVQKADGTSLYITQDIALTQQKMNQVQPDQAYWVIGPEQSLAMKQVFAVCEQLGIARREQLTHIPYGYMSLKGQGKMSSRKGTVVYIDDLLDAAVDHVKQVILGSESGSDSSDNISSSAAAQLEETAEKIGVGAVKYSILRTGRLQDIAFDVSESVQLTGNAGPYLQYTFVRCYSLISKLMKLMSMDTTNLQNSDIVVPFDILINNKAYTNYQWQATEIDILRNLYKYYEVLDAAAVELAPQHLCTYLHELSQQFNVFYASQPILVDAKDGARDLADLPAAVQARLLLVLAVAVVVKDGLNLLGIDVVDRM